MGKKRFAAAKFFLCALAFNNFLDQIFVGFREFRRALHNPLIQFDRDAPLFVQEACLMQSDHDLVCGDAQEKDSQFALENPDAWSRRR